MHKLPSRYAFLRANPLPPNLVKAALDMYGTLETPGTADNPVIVGWADEVSDVCGTKYNNWAADFYNDDAIPWCGLFTAVICARTMQNKPERAPVDKYLSALAWANWGVAIPFKGKLSNIFVGDILVFVRKGGGHVGICVGVSKDGKTVFVLGGNQKDRVNIMELSVDRLYAVRRPPYVNKPEGARHVRLDSTGIVSRDEQ